MASHRLIRCPPRTVFAVLGNWNLLTVWIGAAPAAGHLNRLRNRGQASLGSDMVMTHWEPPRHAVVLLRSGFLGWSELSLTVEPGANGCLVHLSQVVLTGPRLAIPDTPRRIGLDFHGERCLQRLAQLAEHHWHDTVDSFPDRLQPGPP